LIVLRDVTSQWNLKNELHYQATHDALTGLLNRREFENRIDEFIQHGRRTGVKHSFCFIDLNKFKKINDQYGHIAGDSLLKELSRHFLAQLRKGDVLGRLGGDEFGLILGACSGENAIRILKELQANLAKRKFSYNDESFHITASIGLIDFGPETPSVKDMLHVADFACYKAKRSDQGAGSVVYIPGNI
jgi:diguanylate cyclase (GGDEF)-like protein